MRRWALLLAILGFVFALPGMAFGYWLSAPTPATLRVVAGSLPAGLAPTVVGQGSSVTITPTPVVGAVDAYLIERSAIGGAVVSTLRCSTACGETRVPDGRWVYTETPLLASWRGVAGPASAPVTIDTTPPSPVLVSPVATNSVTPVLLGRAGVAPGDASTVTVRLYAGSRELAHQTVPVRNGRWRWQVARLTPQRRYAVVVQQRDSAGNSGQSRSSLVIDTRGPDVRLAPVRWPAFSGQAGTVPASSTSSADSTMIDLQILSGRRLVTTLSTTRVSGHWAVLGSGLGTGDYTARAVQRDAAGNVSVSQIRPFSIDATAPVVSVEVPAYVRTAPILTGRAGTATGDRASVVVEVAPIGGSVVQRHREPVLGGGWRSVLRPLTPGRHYRVTVTQTDAAGNQGSAVADFVLDIRAPKVTMAYAGGLLTGRAGVQAATDQASPDDQQVSVTFSQHGTTAETLTAPVLAGGFSLVPPQLPPGDYQVTASQADAAGNVGQSVPITITVGPPAS